MKGDCKIKKLGDVCDVINGLWTGKKEPFINICVIRNTNFTKDCKLNLDDVAYIDAEVKQFSTRKLQVGDIIVEKSGGSDKQPVGRVVLFDVRQGDYSFSNFTSALRVKGDVVPKYLHKCLVAHYRRGETEKLQSKTTGIRNLDMKGYLRLPIPIRPLPEQERIVAELDCLSGAIEKQKQQLKELDNLAQAIFYDMFGDPITNEKGWEVKTLGNMCDIINGFAFKSPLFTEDGDYILRISNIQDGYVDLKDVAYFHKSDYPKVNFEKYAVLPNDIVVALSGATTGKLGINKTGFKLYLNQRVAICREKSDKILREYLLYYLHEQSKKFLSDAAGVAQPNLSTEQMKEYKMCVPPISVQQEFASKIEAIEKQKELIKQSLSETETLFNSRMDYYFN